VYPARRIDWRVLGCVDAGVRAVPGEPPSHGGNDSPPTTTTRTAAQPTILASSRRRWRTAVVGTSGPEGVHPHLPQEILGRPPSSSTDQVRPHRPPMSVHDIGERLAITRQRPVDQLRVRGHVVDRRVRSHHVVARRARNRWSSCALEEVGSLREVGLRRVVQCRTPHRDRSWAPPRPACRHRVADGSATGEMKARTVQVGATTAPISISPRTRTHRRRLVGPRGWTNAVIARRHRRFHVAIGLSCPWVAVGRRKAPSRAETIDGRRRPPGRVPIRRDARVRRYTSNTRSRPLTDPSTATAITVVILPSETTPYSRSPRGASP
jgi:hypothetical protein